MQGNCTYAGLYTAGRTRNSFGKIGGTSGILKLLGGTLGIMKLWVVL